MQSKRSLALRRFLKVLIAGAVASTAAFVAGPDLANVVGTQDAVVLGAILTPVLSGLEKGYLKQTS